MSQLEEIAIRFARVHHELNDATGTRAGELAIATMAARHDLDLLADVPCGCDDGTCPGLLTQPAPEPENHGARRVYPADDKLMRGPHRIFERFFAKIRFDNDQLRPNVETGCWEWTGNRDRGGYALFRDGKKINGHKWAYERFVGPVPEGMELDHLCRNRACVNPWHLEPVTHSENVQRGDTPRVTRERNLRANPMHVGTEPGDSVLRGEL